ncbi:hypothetical protein DNTS_015422 [Danionella cerebrum]|uniref:TELO2-interacting protein 2 n=1 Tax=Danionella cerebrum TaxID=2873325 RepID=A0A553R3X6_9TELE|nr:hypothetical protein DNTS_015422 [Danionella translucida]
MEAMEVSDILQEVTFGQSADESGVFAALCRFQSRFESEASPGGRARVLQHTAELLTNASLSWLFPEGESSSLRRQYLKLLTSFVSHAALPESDTDSDAPPARSYEGIPGRCLEVCAVFLALSAQIEKALVNPPGSSASLGTLVRTLAPTLCLFCITHLQKQPWSDAASRSRASELQAAVQRMSGSGSPHEMLSGSPEEERTGLFGPVLDLLLPDLTKSRWKRKPSVKLVFSWMLLQVARPRLAEHLEKVFPASLLISDDYWLENKVLGVKCLHHIVLNVPAADLRQFNRASVLHHMLFSSLHSFDGTLAQVIDLQVPCGWSVRVFYLVVNAPQVVLPCLIDLLSVIENPASVPRTSKHFDQVFRHILTYMEMEHKLDLRRVYAENLVVLVERMGVWIIRHLKRLERVIVGYLEVSDAPEEKARLSILDALEKTLRIAWPRVERRLEALARSLLRFLVDVSSSTSPLREQLMEKASCCLMLLECSSRGKLQQLAFLRTSPPPSSSQTVLLEVDSSCVPGPVFRCIQSVLCIPGAVGSSPSLTVPS